MAETTMSRRERKAARRAGAAVATREPSAADVVTSLVAAAVHVQATRNYSNVRWGVTDWQSELWLHYRSCPEFQSAINIGANNLSRARLIGVEVDPATGEPGTQPTTDPDVTAIMGDLFGGPSGQGQALAAIKRHLDVAGDLWVFATDMPDVSGTQWEILATGDVTATSGGSTITVRQLDGTPREVDQERELLVRIWRPAPDRRWDAISSAMALLPVLRELAALSAMVSATVKSRLASAGILWIPDEIALPKANTTDTFTINGQADAPRAEGAANAWLDLITEAMTAPIKDPDSASAVVPMVATVKGELIEKISHMEFGRDLDGVIEPLREACVKRIAVGMNAPPEILLGLASANHWTAWTITEDYAKAYLAPDLELVCDALSRYYLRPALQARGKDPDRFAVYFDMDRLVPKQINIDNAQKAYDAGLLSEVEYMEVLGFSKSQMADPAERGRRLLTNILTGHDASIIAALAPVLTQLFPGTPQVVVPPMPAAPARETVTESVPDGAVPKALPASPTATGGPPNPAGAMPSTSGA